MIHPTANITGFISLTMHPYATVQDYCVITCPKTKLKALLKYHDEVLPAQTMQYNIVLARKTEIPN